MRRLLVLGALLYASAHAQEPTVKSSYINLEATDLVPYGTSLGWHDIRTIGGHEMLTYATVGGRFGLNDKSEGFLRLVIADQKNAIARQGGTIRFGGIDFEAGIKFKVPTMEGVFGMVSMSAPQSPAQKGPVLAIGLATERQLSEKVSFELNPRATIVRRNGIAGLGSGLKFQLAQNLGLTTEFTWVFMGNNTRSIDNGELIRRNVFGVGVHYGLKPDTELGFGWTNATGGTTGFGLTPGLGASNGFYLSVRGKF